MKNEMNDFKNKDENKMDNIGNKIEFIMYVVMGIIYIIFGSAFVTLLNPFRINNIEGEGKTILYVMSVAAILVIFYGLKKIVDGFKIKNELINTRYNEEKEIELNEEIEHNENKFLKIYATTFLSGMLIAIMIYLINEIKVVGIFNIEIFIIIIFFVIPISTILYKRLKNK